MSALDGQKTCSHGEGFHFQSWQVCFLGKISGTLQLKAEQVNWPGVAL